MKTLLIPFFVMITLVVNAQIDVELGYYIKPIFSIGKNTYMDEYSLMPNVGIAIGDAHNKFFISTGSYQTIGGRIDLEYMYSSAYYSIGILNKDNVWKHGSGIELGFNYRFNSLGQTYRIQFGSSLSLLGKINSDYPEIMVVPLAVGFSVKFNNKKLYRKTILFAKK